MGQVRTQPLPAGRYWIDVRGAQLDPWMAWVRSNPQLVTVDHSEAVEVQPVNAPAVGITFFIFRTSKPLRFDQKSFGFPTTAGPEVHVAADTDQRPPVPTIKSEILDPLLDKVQEAASSNLGRALLIGVLIAAFSKVGSND